MAKAESKDTPESTLYAIEDVWLKAINELPDTKPLADLLRTYSVPMPPGARDFLAELLSPGDPDIYGGRLVYKPTGTFRQIAGKERLIGQDNGLLSLVKDYYDEVERRKRAGEKDPSQGAAAAIGEKTGQDGRTVYRKVKAWRALVARLRGLK
jgi:hypothetical protein